MRRQYEIQKRNNDFAVAESKINEAADKVVEAEGELNTAVEKYNDIDVKYTTEKNKIEEGKENDEAYQKTEAQNTINAVNDYIAWLVQ
jgi:hypothetical protein